MKNSTMEKRYQQMKAYHRHRPWRLREGLFIPHSYVEFDSNHLTWWDDVGFIMNKRRILVNWIHPRQAYHDQIKELARQQFPYPSEISQQDIFAPAENKYKKVGKSRKKILSTRIWSFPDELKHYYQHLNRLEEKLGLEGIDFTVKPAMTIEILPWCRRVELRAPVEVTSIDEVKALVTLSKKLIKNETTLDQLFSDYQYNKQAWLAEANLRTPQLLSTHQLKE